MKLKIHTAPTEHKTNIGQQKDNHWWHLPTRKEKSSLFKPHHIYLTSDEDFKTGDWIYNKDGMGNPILIKVSDGWNTKLKIGYRKVVVTTDWSISNDLPEYISPQDLPNIIKLLNEGIDEVECEKEFNILNELVLKQNSNGSIKLIFEKGITINVGELSDEDAKEYIYLISGKRMNKPGTNYNSVNQYLELDGETKLYTKEQVEEFFNEYGKHRAKDKHYYSHSDTLKWLKEIDL